MTPSMHHQGAVDYSRPEWSKMILSYMLSHLVMNRQTEKNIHIYNTFSNTVYSEKII